MRFVNLLGLVVIAIMYVNCFPAIDGQRSLYTPKEIQAIRKFRPMVSRHLTQDFMKRDGYLLRFIRNYDFNLGKAARRLEYSANWRKDKKIDGILNENHRFHIKESLVQLGGVDKEGNPIVYYPGGKWDLRKYIASGKRDIFLRAIQQAVERPFQNIWNIADRTGKDVDQYHMIVDLDGFHARQNLCLGCIPLSIEMAAALDAITPVFVRKLIIINAPRSSVPLINLLRSTFPFPPLSLMRVYDDNSDVWKKELLKGISPDQLLKKYGGTKEG